jgi:hypothetical protein
VRSKGVDKTLAVLSRIDSKRARIARNSLLLSIGKPLLHIDSDEGDWRDKARRSTMDIALLVRNGQFVDAHTHARTMIDSLEENQCKMHRKGVSWSTKNDCAAIFRDVASSISSICPVYALNLVKKSLSIYRQIFFSHNFTSLRSLITKIEILHRHNIGDALLVLDEANEIGSAALEGHWIGSKIYASLSRLRELIHFKRGLAVNPEAFLEASASLNGSNDTLSHLWDITTYAEMKKDARLLSPHLINATLAPTLFVRMMEVMGNLTHDQVWSEKADAVRSTFQ